MDNHFPKANENGFALGGGYSIGGVTQLEMVVSVGFPATEGAVELPDLALDVADGAVKPEFPRFLLQARADAERADAEPAR